METILFYDTETNGLPNYTRRSDHFSQPRVIQIAAELCVEETGETLAAMDMLIKPNGWTIPENIQQLTGITMERAQRDGLDMDTVMQAFIATWKDADRRIAHNESFDARMIRIELVRHAYFSGISMQESKGDIPFADYWKAAPAYCTQANSTKILNPLRQGKKKTASLAEAYKHFTGADLFDAHDAKVDVAACKAVYYGIKLHNSQAG
jgi:DNA polymerase-3 subunit epsilon